jgi:hypothetical protein
MVDLPGGPGQRDPNVIRLSHQYAACPSCQLVLPLYDDPDGWAGDHAGATQRDAVPPSLPVALWAVQAPVGYRHTVAAGPEAALP